MPEPATPADEIQAAAERLRGLARAVPAPPWSRGGIGDYGWTVHCGDLATDRAAVSLDTCMDNDEGKVLTAFIATIARMRSEPAAYKALGPANGWGNYEGALDYLTRLLGGCTRHPKAQISVSH